MKKALLIFSLFACAISVLAKPARRGERIITLPDGTETIVYQHGDERFHWTTDSQGNWIAQDEQGNWHTISPLSEEEIISRREASKFSIADKAHMRKASSSRTETPINIAQHGLIILVEFQDLDFATPKAEMDSMHKGLDYSRSYSYTYNRVTYNVQSQGSARQYFRDASFGQYDPQFDIVGPVRVSRNYSYYGKNNYSGDDMYPDQMVWEACQLVDSLYPEIDFSIYDNDKDGEVDYVYAIYAGYGEADGGSSNTIWPHSYWLDYGGYNLNIDGVHVNKYACGNEVSYLSGQTDGIGTFCHEFSHVLGLPDFYTTNSATHRTLNEWDVMDYGPYNNDGNSPPTYSAYERFFFGWLTPTLLTGTDTVVVPDLLSTNQAYIISPNDRHNLIGNDPDTTVFYLIENRQSNIWDQYLAGEGMILTKVQYSRDKWYQNTVNNTKSKMGVDMIEAKSNTSATCRATDLFPAGATEYNGIADHTISDIKVVEDSLIQFYFASSLLPLATEHVAEDTANEIVAIYRIDGSLVANAAAAISALPSGIYIVRREQSTEKILVP